MSVGVIAKTPFLYEMWRALLLHGVGFHTRPGAAWMLDRVKDGIFDPLTRTLRIGNQEWKLEGEPDEIAKAVKQIVGEAGERHA